MQQGISSKALTFGNSKNTKKYQGYEYNTDFDINLYETFYRSHDPQLGRFCQIDPKPDERISLYTAMGNNPISLTDFLGDTTRYYSEAGGDPIYTTYGKGYNHAMIVKDNKVDYVNSIAEKLKGKTIDPEMGVIIDFLASSMNLGTTYDIGSFTKFYDDNSTTVEAESAVGYNIPKGSSVYLDGKKQDKIYAEVGANLIMNGGMVRVGKNPIVTSKKYTSIDNDKFTNEKGKVGEIHLHPYPEGIFNIRIPGVVTGTGKGGPSPDDQSRKLGIDKYSASLGYRNVVVDSKNVYLINGRNDNQTIKIPR